MRFLTVGGALLVAACGSGQKPAKQTDQVACAEPNYEGISTAGGVGVLNVSNIEASYEEKAIREMDVHVERYRAAMLDLCRMYQAGKISTDRYLEESRQLRSLLEPASEYVMKLNQTKDYGERKRLVTELYRTLVPATVREQDLELQFSLAVRLPDGSESTAAPGACLPSNTQAHFEVAVNHTSHVYIFQRNTQNRVSVLFPHAGIGTRNPLQAGSQQRIPPTDQQWFRLNDEDVGTEHVYLIASPNPIAALDTVSARVAQGSVTEVSQAPELTELASLSAGRDGSDCRTRAFELAGTAPAGKPHCARTRGWVLAGDAPGGSDTSMTVRTDPGDDVIVKDFPFHHVTEEQWRGKGCPSMAKGAAAVQEW